MVGNSHLTLNLGSGFEDYTNFGCVSILRPPKWRQVHFIDSICERSENFSLIMALNADEKCSPFGSCWVCSSDVIFYAGGSIWTLDWCPRRSGWSSQNIQNEVHTLNRS